MPHRTECRKHFLKNPAADCGILAHLVNHEQKLLA
jgi:hypothetical protein